MEAVGIAILIIVATFVCCSFIKYTKSCKHVWGKWSDPITAETHTSFNSSKKTYQVRLCEKCNAAESLTVAEVLA